MDYQSKAKKLTTCAMIAALYAALSLVLAPISFGQVQLRVAEALVLLPVFSPYAIAGVTLGCLMANCIGVALGVTLPMDILFGTLATLVAAVLTYLLRGVRIKGLPVLAALPPVLVNAAVIGWEITYFFFPAGSPLAVYAFNALWVGLGEIAACFLLGLPLVYTLQKTKLDERLFGVRQNER